MREGNALSTSVNSAYHLPKGWEMKKLGDVCENLDSKRVPITKNKRVAGSIPYYGASGIVDYVKDFLFDEDLLLISEDGANLLARSYPIAFSISGKTWVNNHAHVLRFEELTTQNFVEYYFNSIKLDNFVSGMAQPKLNQKSLNSIAIPIPPLSEQKQIVAILDKAFAAIDQAQANIQKNIENAKELFQSKLNEIFSHPSTGSGQDGEGWEEKSLGKVCKIESKLINPQDPKYQNLIHVGGGNIVAETGELIDLKTAKEEGLKSGKFAFDTSVVLYNKIRPYLVKVSRPDFSGLCSADMYPLTPFRNQITRDFLYYLLISKRFTDYAIVGSARAGMPKVNRKHLFGYTFSLPPIEIQKIIIEKLDILRIKSQSLQIEYSNKISYLEALKKSILQKAFSGELTSPEGTQYGKDGRSPSEQAQSIKNPERVV